MAKACVFAPWDSNKLSRYAHLIERYMESHRSE
jgi:hypothetical protein